MNNSELFVQLVTSSVGASAAAGVAGALEQLDLAARLRVAEHRVGRADFRRSRDDRGSLRRLARRSLTRRCRRRLQPLDLRLQVIDLLQQLLLRRRRRWRIVRRRHRRARTDRQYGCRINPRPRSNQVVSFVLGRGKLCVRESVQDVLPVKNAQRRVNASNTRKIRALQPFSGRRTVVRDVNGLLITCQFSCPPRRPV